MLLVVALVCLLLVCGYAVIQRRSRTRQCLAHLPTYPQLPLVGSGHYLLGDGRHIFLRLMEMMDISEKCQLPFVIWMGPYPCLLLDDIDDIKSVNNEFLEKPYYYNFAQPWLGDGLLTASVGTWKRNIKKLAGTFNNSSVESFQHIFNSQAQKLATSLKTETGRGPFNVLEKYLAENTLETICQIVMGVPKISDNIIPKEYYAAFTRMVELMHIRGFNFLFHSDVIFGLTSYKKELTKVVQKLHHVSETVMKIRQEREDHQDNSGLHTNNSGYSKSSFKSFLDLLLELNAKDPTFTMKQVRNELDTIILAGQETVATSMFYILLMIGCHAEVQDKLHAEIKEIFGDSKREMGKEDLARMTYCEAVIYETLRLFPPVPAGIRIADHELKLKSCTVPKGTNCVMNIFGVGRAKKYWGPDALKFRPERFKSDSMPAILAFSVGRRACIGKKYAMLIMKTMIAHCVRELVFQADPDKIELKIDIALRTVSNKLLQVNLRQS